MNGSGDFIDILSPCSLGTNSIHFNFVEENTDYFGDGYYITFLFKIEYYLLNIGAKISRTNYGWF